MLSIRVTLLNADKSRVVKLMQSSRKLPDTCVTLLSGEKSTVVKLLQPERKRVPITVTLLNPERSTLVKEILNLKNVIHPRKKKNQQKGRMAPRCAREWFDPIC